VLSDTTGRNLLRPFSDRSLDGRRRRTSFAKRVCLLSPAGELWRLASGLLRLPRRRVRSGRLRLVHPGDPKASLRGVRGVELITAVLHCPSRPRRSTSKSPFLFPLHQCVSLSVTNKKITKQRSLRRKATWWFLLSSHLRDITKQPPKKLGQYQKCLSWLQHISFLCCTFSCLRCHCEFCGFLAFGDFCSFLGVLFHLFLLSVLCVAVKLWESLPGPFRVGVCQGGRFTVHRQSRNGRRSGQRGK